MGYKICLEKMQWLKEDCDKAVPAFTNRCKAVGSCKVTQGSQKQQCKWTMGKAVMNAWAQFEMNDTYQVKDFNVGGCWNEMVWGLNGCVGEAVEQFVAATAGM